MSRTINPGPHDYDCDMVIIGGGIYGAALLWEASHRGLKVLLLEKNDFSGGASANSLKTIHGGIRYLQQLNLKRVIESDREKVILNKVAPNLIRPLTCCLPVSNSTTNSYLAYWFASRIFNSLSCLSPLGSGHHLDIYSPASSQRSLSIFKSNLAMSGQPPPRDYLVWQDAQAVSSERLALAFIRSSRAYDGMAKNYSEVSNVTVMPSGGYQITYNSDSEKLKLCSAKFVVDCTGGDEFSRKFGPLRNNENLKKNNDHTEYVAGLNIILDKQFSDYAFALPSYNKALKKKGMLFFSPWKNSTLAGTWYFKRSVISSRADVTKNTISNCIADIKSALDIAGLSFDEMDLNNIVVDFHLGFLPGDGRNNNPENSLFSKPVIMEDGAGYYCLQGNKYTTARLNAKNLIDKVTKLTGKIKPSRSHELVLSGANIFSAADMGKTDAVWQILAERYGDLIPLFHDLIELDASGLELVPGSYEIYQAEVDFFSKEESVNRLADLLYRRINHNVNKPITKQTIMWCAMRLAKKMGWDQLQLESNIKEVSEIEENKRRLSRD